MKLAKHFSPHAPLAALGLKLQQLELLKPIREGVAIRQKTLRQAPLDKLLDALIAILAGAQGLCEINTRLRADPALQRAFGRAACADQSVVQATLNACTSTNVAQLMRALDTIFQQHSLAHRHDFRAALLLLDIDLTGLPCGKTCEYSAKGYQGEVGVRWGRQMGRVIAAPYQEVVLDRLYPGNLHLTKVVRPLVEDLEQTLALVEAKRKRTIIRMDAGGGSLDEINWLLERGYQIHGKDISAARAESFAQFVTHWIDDPRHLHRQIGWADCDSVGFVRPVRRLVLRWAPMKQEEHKKRPFRYACLLSTLKPAEVIEQLHLPKHTVRDNSAVALAYSTLYDQRGGTVEVEIKESKQGVGINKRSKKRFAAQQIVMLLGSLAHNLIIWARRWLAQECAIFSQYGIKRFVRDLFQISGLVELDVKGKLRRVTLNKTAVRAQEMARALRALVAEVEIKVGVT